MCAPEKGWPRGLLAHPGARRRKALSESIGRVREEANSTPKFGDHVLRELRDRGWSPFGAARFSRLPIDAQIAGMIMLDEEADLGERELLDDLDEVERQRRAE